MDPWSHIHRSSWLHTQSISSTTLKKAYASADCALLQSNVLMCCASIVLVQLTSASLRQMEFEVIAADKLGTFGYHALEVTKCFVHCLLWTPYYVNAIHTMSSTQLQINASHCSRTEEPFPKLILSTPLELCAPR